MKKKTTNMENQLVDFNLHAYRELLNDKVKSLQQLEQLYDDQNKSVVNKLLEEKILTVVNNQVVPSGIITTPADGKQYTEEEINYNKNERIRFQGQSQGAEGNISLRKENSHAISWPCFHKHLRVFMM